MKLLGRLNDEQGTTIIVVTHDSKVGSRAHRMLFLNDGKLLKRERKGSHLTKTTCPDCGKELSPEDAFCAGCGKRL
jgi:ABC-type cobalamin/Fe3+-siderophores transport system ATPase subunit